MYGTITEPLILPADVPTGPYDRGLPYTPLTYCTHTPIAYEPTSLALAKPPTMLATPCAASLHSAPSSE